MYLAPWQIFASGCVCGALITFIILVAIIVGLVRRSAVKVEHIKEENDHE